MAGNGMCPVHRRRSFCKISFIFLGWCCILFLRHRIIFYPASIFLVKMYGLLSCLAGMNGTATGRSCVFRCAVSAAHFGAGSPGAGPSATPKGSSWRIMKKVLAVHPHQRLAGQQKKQAPGRGPDGADAPGGGRININGQLTIKEQLRSIGQSLFLSAVNSPIQANRSKNKEDIP